MKNIAKSGKNTLRKTRDAKYVMDKQRTFTIKNEGEKIYARSILSWLFAAPVTPESKPTLAGRGKMDT